VAEQVPSFSELIAATTTSAVHLEMRDAYMPGDPEYISWRLGKPTRSVSESPEWSWWYRLVRASVDRGVAFRRARIVSEPLADPIRFEYEITSLLNIPAGERVRWLPRRRASDLCLPGNDFWIFDERRVRFTHFDGDGELTGHELSDDPAVVRLCADAFESVWERAIDHERYRPASARR
jgi:hypothetical protein